MTARRDALSVDNQTGRTQTQLAEQQARTRLLTPFYINSISLCDQHIRGSFLHTLPRPHVQSHAPSLSHLLLERAGMGDVDEDTLVDGGGEREQGSLGIGAQIACTPRTGPHPCSPCSRKWSGLAVVHTHTHASHARPATLCSIPAYNSTRRP
ncbi:hypothetical protein DFH11DRAFT_191584 [Phellopilus nigrolimitatus]|nr:hypothetical protein DFH11DRAFT_191584 [Phellopilus nigrolimitatus]